MPVRGRTQRDPMFNVYLENGIGIARERTFMDRGPVNITVDDGVFMGVGPVVRLGFYPENTVLYELTVLIPLEQAMDIAHEIVRVVRESNDA